MSDEPRGSTAEHMLLGLRFYLIVKALESGCTFYEAADAVLEMLGKGNHNDPVLRTYAEWEERLNKKDK